MQEQQFRDLLSTLAAGVSVITFEVDGHVHGFTATSCTAVSMNPPLMLFCLARHSRSAAWLRPGQALGVSLLGAAQQEIAGRFARSGRPLDPPDAALARSEAGVPLVRDANTTLEARLVEQYPAGDHLICVCALERGAVRRAGEPLLYFGRGYRRLADAGPKHPAASDGDTEARPPVARAMAL